MFKKSFLAPVTAMVVLLSLTSFVEADKGSGNDYDCTPDPPNGQSVKKHCVGKYGYNGYLCMRGQNCLQIYILNAMIIECTIQFPGEINVV